MIKSVQIQQSEERKRNSEYDEEALKFSDEEDGDWNKDLKICRRQSNSPVYLNRRSSEQKYKSSDIAEDKRSEHSSANRSREI